MKIAGWVLAALVAVGLGLFVLYRRSTAVLREKAADPVQAAAAGLPVPGGDVAQVTAGQAAPTADKVAPPPIAPPRLPYETTNAYNERTGAGPVTAPPPPKGKTVTATPLSSVFSGLATAARIR